MLRLTAILLAFTMVVGCSRDRARSGKTRLPLVGFSPPAPNQTLSGSVVVGGWAIHASGIASVKVYADGKFLLDGNIGLDRPDVAAVYPAYKKQMISGWNALIDTTSLEPGEHELLAKVRAKDGSEREVRVPVVIANPK